MGIQLTTVLNATIRNLKTLHFILPQYLKCFRMLSFFLLVRLKLSTGSLLSEKNLLLQVQLMMESVVLQRSRQLVPQYAATMIVEQLKLAHSVQYEMSESGDDNQLVSPSGRVHTVSVSSDLGLSCSCSFHGTLLRMPCRHIFFTHLHQTVPGPVVEATMVANHWLKQYQLLVDVSTVEPPSAVQEPEAQVSVISSGVNLTHTLARNQKYKKMLTLSQTFAVIASQCGMAEFRKKFSEVQCLVRY